MHIRPLSVLMIILPLLMTACNGSHTSKTGINATDNAKSTGVDDLLGGLQSATMLPEQSKLSAYAHQIREAITVQMHDINTYTGKTCVIRISLQPDGSVNNATAKEGDEKLCKAVISAITRAQIPAAPDEETYQRFKNANLDFRL